MIKKREEYIKEEVGIRNLKTIAKEFKTCEIWFHMDLDGVTSAIAMKEFLKNFYQIPMIDCHVIQYGNKEFSIQEQDTSPDNLPILVDFAHAKVNFLLFDHHDSQLGVDSAMGSYIKPAKSNAGIISGEISYSELFTASDLKLINTVDSADFVKNNIKPEDLHDSVFNLKKSETAGKNRFMMGFVVNRLLLAYKNKRINVKKYNNKNFLECLVLDSTASLYSMFNNMRYYINNATTNDRAGKLATPEEIKANLTDYINRMKNYSFVEDSEGEAYEISNNELKILKIIKNTKHELEIDALPKQLGIDPKLLVDIIDKLEDKKYIYYNDRSNSFSVSKFGKKVMAGERALKGVHMDSDYNIIMQYGGGNMFKPGSYDRYTPFKNNPKAEFLCIVWPMGLIQLSCNPFIEKKLENINLGEIAKEVLAKHEPMLSRYYIPLEAIKKEYETSQDYKKMRKEEGSDYKGVGFKYSDLVAFYSDVIFKKEGGKIVNVDVKDEKLEKIMDTFYGKLTKEEIEYLNTLKIPAWEIIKRNSGGHPSITNLSGINFLKYNKQMLNIAYKTQKYTDVLKKIARELVTDLKEKIDLVKKGEEIKYDTKGIKLLGSSTNENYKYSLVDNDGDVKKVTMDNFIKAGVKKGMKDIKIDSKEKTIIAKFENFKNNL